jgi:ATP-binding cassette subfamily B protein
MSGEEPSSRSSDQDRAAPGRKAAATARRGRLFHRRVPVVHQATATECGAACLAMILSYHGRPTRVGECRALFGVGRDGIKGRALAEAARSFGLRVRAFSSDLDHLHTLPLPLIAHWGFHHFIVIERVGPKRVDVIDPALGRRALSWEELGKGFTGVALTFEPGPDFQAGGARRSTWRELVRHVLAAPGARGLAAQVLAASVLLQALGLSAALATKVVVDRVVPLGDVSLLGVLGAGMGVVVLAQLATSYLREALLIYLQARFDERLMLGLFGHLLRLPWSFFQQRTAGDLLTRLGSSAMIRELVTGQSLSLVLDGVLVVAYLAILLLGAPSFALLGLGFGAAQALLLLGTAGLVRELTQRHLAADAEAQGFAVQALRGIMTFKAAAAEDRALDFWSNLFYKQLNVSIARSHLTAAVGALLGAIRAAAPLALLWVGAGTVIAGETSLGTMLAQMAVAAAFLAPLGSLVTTAQRMQIAGVHLERVMDLLDAEPEQPQDAALPSPRLAGRIALEGASFRFGREGAPVLEDISVAIEPGQKVALVGRTGSGKSTLAMLMLGIHQPTEGRILFDSVPLAELNMKEVRRQIGVVLQEPFLVAGSIRQNVTLTDPTLPFERVVEAIRLAALEPDVLAMPMRYDTWVGEGGAGLSGGQKQRLALARALVTRPSILLLDEATSHLDATTERQVDENLGGMASTRIVIAHRLSTIRNADVILVLEGGRVVERGTHAELIAKSSHYAALVQSQGERGERSMTAADERDPVSARAEREVA